MNQIMINKEETNAKEYGKHSKKGSSKKDKKKKRGIFKKVLITLLILFIIGVSSLGVLLYGPYNGFRDWLITTAMTTMTHQWIAHLFYSDETIEAVMANNRVEEID